MAITVALHYKPYGGGVATLMLTELRMPFGVFVLVLAAGNLLSTFGSLLAGFADRLGRANLIVYGLLAVGLMTLFVWSASATACSWSCGPRVWTWRLPCAGRGARCCISALSHVRAARSPQGVVQRFD